MTVGFLSLPVELLVDVMVKAGTRGILSCRKTRRSLRDVVRDNAKLQYFVELFAACKVENLTLDVPYAHALDSLRQCERSWRQLQWRASLDSIEPPFNSLLFGIDFSCGTFVTRNWRTPSNPRAWAILPNLEDSQLPARSDIEWHQYNTTLGYPVDSCCVDASQDLFANLKVISNGAHQSRIYVLELWSLSAYSPHPEAMSPTVRLHMDCGHFFNEHTMHVAGDHIGVIFTTGDFHDQFALVDWKSGVRKDSSHCFPLERSWSDFAFLNDTTLLLPTTNNLTCVLDVYKFSTAPGSLHHIASFDIPPTRFGWSAACSAVLSSPDDYALDRSVATSSRTREYFHHDSGESILTIFLNFDHPVSDSESDYEVDLPVRSYFLITSKATFLLRLHDLMTNLMWEDILSIPWHEWGPRRARILLSHHSWRTYEVHGTRFMAAGHYLEIYDFNRFLVRRQPDMDLGTTEDSFLEYVYDPTIMLDEDVFSESLPGLAYRKVTRHTDFDWWKCFMDDRRIIGIGGPKKLDLLLF